MNILKSSSILENDEFRKVSKHFNFDNIFGNLFPSAEQYRFFEISRPDEKTICFSPQEDLEMLANIVGLSPFLNTEEKSLLLEITKKKNFNIHQRKRILTYLHIDWLLAYNKIREYENETEIPVKLQEQFYFITLMNHKDILKKIQGNAKQRSNIYTINKDSIVIPITNTIDTQNDNKLSNDTIELIKSIPLISFLEISKGIDEHKLYEFLQGVKRACKKVQMDVNNVTDDMKFCLKIRKIKRTFKKAMYIQAQNSVIVDPRHTDSFYHELGHWYHTMFKPEIIDREKAEEFAERFALQMG